MKQLIKKRQPVLGSLQEARALLMAAAVNVPQDLAELRLHKRRRS